MKKVIALLALLLVFGVMPILAQNIIYEDPAGRFSVPVPSDWKAISTSEIVRFASTTDVSVSILAADAAEAEAGDQAVLAKAMPDLAGAAPVQTATQPGLNGSIWTMKFFVPASGRFIILSSQWVKGVTYALVFDLPNQEAIAANQAALLIMLNEFSVGKRLDLTGVKAKPFTEEMIAELKGVIEEARGIFHVPGAAIAIVQNGKVVFVDGFGTTETNSKQPITTDTLFMIGSTTKSMTTMMAGTLVDEGALDWDKPVKDILPSFALSEPNASAQIRFRDLLNMSSGVPRYDLPLNITKFTPQELISSLAQIPMVAAPGQIWNYSNQMVATGGYLSTLATGVPMDKLYQGYVNLVQQRVFDPIGMTHSTFDFDAAINNPNHALPFVYDPVMQKYLAVNPDDERFTGNTAPSGAVWSDINDMSWYLQTELSGGVSPDGKRVISEEALHTTQTVEITPAGPFGGYGMGWFIDSYNGLPLIWHGGNTKGFTSDLAFLPDVDLGIVTLTNAGDANDFYKSIRQYAFELAFGLEHNASLAIATAQATKNAQMESASAPATTPIDAKIIEPYLGDYEYGAKLEMHGDEVWFTGSFIQTPLYATAQSGDYAGTGAYSALLVRFVGDASKPALELNYSGNPPLTIKAVSSEAAQVQTDVIFPELSGPYQVGRAERSLLDSTRDEVFTDDPNDRRELMLTVYYPAQPDTGEVPAPYVNETLAAALGLGPDVLAQIHTRIYSDVPVSQAKANYPVVIFSPGMGNLPQSYSVTLQALASNGYIVVSISHPYSTGVTVFPDNRVVMMNDAGSQLHTDSDEADAIKRAKVLAVWVHDVRFVLDQLDGMGTKDPLFAGHLDLTRMGMFGHSFGGETTIETSSQDSRLKAALSLDSQVTGSVVETGITQPFMILRSEKLSMTDEELQAVGVTREQFDAMYAVMDAPINTVYQKAASGYMLSLKGSTHDTYTTDYLLLASLFPSEYPPEAIGTIDHARAVEIINTYVVAFFDKYLKGKEIPLLDAPSPDYPEVTFERHDNQVVKGGT